MCGMSAVRYGVTAECLPDHIDPDQKPFYRRAGQGEHSLTPRKKCPHLGGGHSKWGGGWSKMSTKNWSKKTTHKYEGGVQKNMFLWHFCAQICPGRHFSGVLTTKKRQKLFFGRLRRPKKSASAAPPWPHQPPALVGGGGPNFDVTFFLLNQGCI